MPPMPTPPKRKQRAQAEQEKLKAEEEAKKAAEEAAASGTEQPTENKVTSNRIRLFGCGGADCAGGRRHLSFSQSRSRKSRPKQALNPDANYTEDKGDCEIPTEDEPENR